MPFTNRLVTSGRIAYWEFEGKLQGFYPVPVGGISESQRVDWSGTSGPGLLGETRWLGT